MTQTQQATRTDVPRDRATVEPAGTILANSVVAAVLGVALMVLLHELVHLVTGLALGHAGTLYPFGITIDGNTTPGADAAIALSAPVFSLVTGFACALWLPLRRRGGFAHLLWLWFAFTSILEGAGYLVITLFGAGDTAMAADALDAPLWTRVVATAAGVALMVVAARMFAPHVRRHAGPERPRQWAFAFWPWLLASAVTMGMSLLWVSNAAMELSGGEVAAILAASSSLFVFAPMSFLFARSAAGEPDEPLGLRRVPVAGLVGYAALTAVNVFLLGGLHVG